MTRPSSRPVRVGVLALQGDFAAHCRALMLDPDCRAFELRRPGQLDEADAVVLPGGESTTLLKLLALERMDEALVRFHQRGGFVLGTCAGLILLAREVLSPAQTSLGLLDVTVERNGFGRQKESFVDEGTLVWNGLGPEPMEMVFIRAPRIRKVGSGVEVLATWRGEPVAVRQGRVVGASFHPELSRRPRLHAHFLELVRDNGLNGAGRLDV